ncbi:Fur family transcriptional regulator [Umezawaea sp. Da 62-37]|uniref:Fur family transcriptional regulator n=1 Tax=Umezawaea sp. Da 62-37 TaxID=3075927 RepID=UPI0028F72129|nr:Fur family transcriptional regulator [Umezawaea sp. Da 62-37]WNV86221.1 Fur family transcriptional regulator [Umezawaea sp. Da 62-37]
MPDQSPDSRLRAAGLRVTKPRVAIIQVLDSAGVEHEHLTAAQVAERTRTLLGRGLSVQAVYDCLDALSATGVLRRIEPAGHPMLYEARVGDNHHHLVCRACGRTADVDCTTGDAPCLSPSQRSGFVVDEAEITFWGTCPDCAKQAGDRPGPSTHSSTRGA